MLEFSPDGKFLLAVGSSIKLWSLEGTAEPAASEAVQFPADYHLASQPAGDGTGILSLLQDGSVMETNLASGMQQLYPNTGREITSLSKNFSKERVAYITAEGIAAVWDYRKDEVILEIPIPKKNNPAAVLSENGKRLSTLAKSGAIEIFNVDLGNLMSSFTIEGSPLDAKFSPDGSMLLIHTVDGLQLWQTDPPLLSGNYAGYRGEFSADGKMLALARKDFSDQVIEIWDVQNREKISDFKAEGASLAFSPDASILAMAGRNIVLWPVSGGKQLAELPLQDVPLNGDILFTPGGETLVYGAMDGTLRFWGIQ